MKEHENRAPRANWQSRRGSAVPRASVSRVHLQRPPGAAGWSGARGGVLAHGLLARATWEIYANHIRQAQGRRAYPQRASGNRQARRTIVSVTEGCVRARSAT